MENKVFTCDRCGAAIPVSERNHFDGQDLCPDCFSDHTDTCACCGERIWREDNVGDDDTPLCQHCFDHHYVHCFRCGRLIREENACFRDNDDDEEYPYCGSCYVEASTRAIKDYYYKPEPLFYGSGPRYFGVELEVDEAGESNRNASTVLDVANAEETHIYCKHDGSLEDGFEIVTHPMSLDYHCKEMPWATILDKLISLGYRSHQATTCGLHIHVSRAAFSFDRNEQDACIARILYFVEKHWEELLKFSRRTPRQLQRWAARYGYKEHPTEILEHAKKGSHGGRYTCVNLENYDTIEFRMFRGSLKYNTLIATLQMVNRICDVALCLTDDELKEMSWTTFVSGCTQPELVQYLKERRLYVNEPVEVEVEV